MSTPSTTQESKPLELLQLLMTLGYLALLLIGVTREVLGLGY